MFGLPLGGYIPVPYTTGTVDPWSALVAVGAILAIAIAVAVALVYTSRPAAGPSASEETPAEERRKAA